MRAASVLLVLGVLHAAPTLACSCIGSSDPSKWAQELTDQAVTVVLARIESVTEPGADPNNPYSARITILERFKGNDAVPEVQVGFYLCRDIDLRPREVQVLFLDRDRRVLGCSTYSVSTEDMVAILRKQKPHQQ